MDHPSSSIPILISFFLFLVMLIKIAKKPKGKEPVSNLPPGPWKLPFIGNMHQMVSSELPQQRLRNFALKYGPLMHLQLGEVTAIVISSPEMAKEVMKTHDVIFAFRPPLLASIILSYDSTNIGFANGEYWRQVRKICAMEVMSAKRVRDFRPVREEEVGNLIKSITSHGEGSPVNLSDMISSTNFRITSRSAFGKASKDQDRFISVVFEAVTLASGFDIGDVFPSYKWLHSLGTQRSRLEKLHQEADHIIGDIIVEHRERRKNKKKNASSDGEADTEDLVDVLLNYEETNGNEFSLTTDNIKSIVFDIYAAGSDTTAVTITWAMAEIMKNPRVLEQAQNEVRQVINKRGKFDEAAISEMNYLKQIMKETLRLHPAFPMLLPRESTERCEINGYQIPRKAKVIVNAWAVGRDPRYWSEPDTFIPERFNDSLVDYKGNSFEFIPFGAGRRMCPGMSFALASVELFLSMLLYHFDWKLPNGMKHEDLNMEYCLGVTARRKHDLYLVPTLYQPSSTERIPPWSVEA